MRFLYTVLLYLTIPFILLRLLWRSRRLPAYRQRWLERFGFSSPISHAIWIHAVSVGEIQAAIPLIQTLKNQYLILVTTTTPTGSQRIREVFGDQVSHVYLPYDLPGALRRFLARAKPKLLILMETELWPNLLHACQQRAIPVILANARLSDSSTAGYQRFSHLTQRMLSQLTVIAAQSPVDAERFLALGANPQHMQVIGNIKFDSSLPADLPKKSSELRAQWGAERPIWIAASTHPGEEEQILEAFTLIKPKYPQLLLVLVPRHPDRFNSVATLCQQYAYTVARRSCHEKCTSQTEIYLGDTLGELLLLYAASDVAFVGGSLVPVGGHNVLEPALLRLPIITGPYQFNFADITRLLVEADALDQVTRVSQLAESVENLLRDAPRRQQMGDRAYNVVVQNRGALARLLVIVNTQINQRRTNST